MKVSLIGMGPGDPALLTRAAAAALDRAALLAGAPRLLEPYREGPVPCREAVAPKDVLRVLREEEPEEAAVLLSGDLGFYSGARKLLPLLREAGFETVCHCGVSSLQYLCGKTGRPWEDICTASAHGRPCRPEALLRRHPALFLLTGEKKGQTPGDLCRMLAEGGFADARVWVGSRLSYPDEVIAIGRAEEFAGIPFPPLSAMLVERGETGPLWPYATPGIPDGAFRRGEVPMTKEEVRSAALCKLRVAPGETLWDVGAGTGSVSVEMALLVPDGRVFAVERSEAALRLIRENAARFGAGNLSVIPGEAPEALAELPPPDGVFVGGSGGRLREILALALEKNPRVRAVAAAVTLETLAEGARALAELPFGETEVTQIAVTRTRQAGRYRMLSGQDPVFLLRGEGRG